MMNTNSYLISIVMAAYNAENFIRLAIQSVLKQSYTNWELIIVDDCSIDKTSQIVRSIEDSRIHLIQLNKNIGAGEARNKALDYANGDFIAFLDSDDMWLPFKLEKQIRFMIESKAAICHTSYAFINEEGCSTSGFVRASSSLDLNRYMRSTEIGFSTSVINKKIVGDFNFNAIRLRQDTRLWIDLLKKGFNSKGLDETLVLYRVRSGQISGNKFRSVFRTFKLYIGTTDIPLYARIFNFTCYLKNAMSKRLMSHDGFLKINVLE